MSDKQSHETRLVGIDLAWNCEKNGSGIAIGAIGDGGLHIESVRSEVLSVEEVGSLVTGTPGIRGVAIDAPLIIRNETGSRPCEKALNAVYRKRHAGAHPANLKMRWKSGAELSRLLQKNGFEHVAKDGSRWQLECYPHPAIIETFGLEERHRYKRKRNMSTEDVRNGQIRLGEYLLSLSSSETLPLVFPVAVRQRLAPGFFNQLRPGQLKESEDYLDAILCLYIAGLYEIGANGRVFGDTESGYIYVPTPHADRKTD